MTIISREYQLLWLAQALSSFGEYFFASTASIWVINILFPHSIHLSLYISFLIIVPAIIRIFLGPIAGIFADRYAMRKIMLLADSIRVLLFIVLFMVLGLASSHAAVIFISALLIIVLSEICAQYFNPVRAIFMQNSIPSDKQSDATQYSMLSVTGVAIAATYLGPTIYSWWGIQCSTLIAVGTYLGSWLLIQQIPLLRIERGDRPSQSSYWKDFREGWLFIWKNHALRSLIYGIVAYGLSLGINNESLALFALKTMHLDPQQYGLVAMMFPCGNLLASFFAKKLLHRFGVRKSYISSLLLLGISYLVYSLMRSYIPAVIVMFCSGLIFTIMLMAQGIILLAETPPALMGRISSILNPTRSIAAILGTLITGYCAVLLNRYIDNHIYSYSIMFSALLLVMGGLLIYTTHINSDQ